MVGDGTGVGAKPMRLPSGRKLVFQSPGGHAGAPIGTLIARRAIRPAGGVVEDDEPLPVAEFAGLRIERVAIDPGTPRGPNGTWPCRPGTMQGRSRLESRAG